MSVRIPLHIYGLESGRAFRGGPREDPREETVAVQGPGVVTMDSHDSGVLTVYPCRDVL